jgi:hypothetical protein
MIASGVRTHSRSFHERESEDSGNDHVLSETATYVYARLLVSFGVFIVRKEREREARK